MTKREKLLKECKDLNITFVDDSFSLAEIQEAIENKKMKIAAARKNQQALDKLKEDLDPQQKELAEIYESRGYDAATIKKRVSSPISAASQEEMHKTINADIRARNACRERHGLRKMERLMPVRESVIDLYSHGLIDEWLKDPDPYDPQSKPNLRFEEYVKKIVEELQEKEREVQRAEALKAEVKTRYATLKEVPEKIISDAKTGQVRANEKYKDWIIEAHEFLAFIETHIKSYEATTKNSPDMPDLRGFLESTHSRIISLIEKGKEG
jgi:hypothetical protein